MNSKIIIALSTLTIIILSACTAGTNNLTNTANAIGEIDCLWHDLWHGFISPFTFIISLFKDGISIYEVHNNGNWYNFGFLLGAMCFFGGNGKGVL